MSSYIDVAIRVLPFLLEGFLQTLLVSAVGLIGGSTLGAALGIVRGQRTPGATPIIGAYIHALRGTPFLVQLYVAYFVLPNTGISWLMWNSHTAAIIALSLYTSSYVTEIVSGAIRSVPVGQWEGAFSIGLRKSQTLRLVVIPQAMGLILPALGGAYVNLIKATSIISVVGIVELTRQGEITILRYPGHVLFIYVLIAAIYFLYCYPILNLVGRLEQVRSKVRSAT